MQSKCSEAGKKLDGRTAEEVRSKSRKIYGLDIAGYEALNGFWYVEHVHFTVFSTLAISVTFSLACAGFL